MIATHTLKQKFTICDNETYKKGTLVTIPKKHYKHKGLCCNIAFLNKQGQIKSNKLNMLALFSLDHFKPQKKWFIPI